jgi:hypothetical protein
LSTGSVFEVATEDRVRWEVEPAAEERRIDVEEVDRPFQVAAFEVAERGRRAEEAGVHPGTGEEDGAGRAVIGAERPVLSGPAAELAEGHQDDPVGQPRGGQVVSASSSVLGGGSNRSTARTVPTTNPTGSETRACRLRSRRIRRGVRFLPGSRRASAASRRPRDGVHEVH